MVLCDIKRVMNVYDVRIIAEYIVRRKLKSFALDLNFKKLLLTRVCEIGAP